MECKISQRIFELRKESGLSQKALAKEIGVTQKAIDFWEKGISGSEYISKILEYYSIKYVEDLLDYDEIDKYIDVVHNTNAFLVENIMPDFVNEADIKYVLTNLIKERVSIKNIV